jgi:hypothetical protein
VGAPREVARSGWAGWESDAEHAHYAIAKDYSCFTYTDPLQVTSRAVCSCMELVIEKDSSDTEIDSGTDTEDVESFMSNFVSLLCR